MRCDEYTILLSTCSIHLDPPFCPRKFCLEIVTSISLLSNELKYILTFVHIGLVLHVHHSYKSAKKKVVYLKNMKNKSSVGVRVQEELDTYALSPFLSAICAPNLKQAKNWFFLRRRGKPGAIYRNFFHMLFLTPQSSSLYLSLPLALFLSLSPFLSRLVHVRVHELLVRWRQQANFKTKK